jgi:hypothetical protein
MEQRTPLKNLLKLKMKISNPFSKYCCPAIYFDLTPKIPESKFVVTADLKTYFENSIIDEYTFFDFNKEFFKDTYLESTVNPTIFINGGYVTSFEYLKPFLEIKNLSLDKLDIYFIEMLVVTRNGTVVNEMTITDKNSVSFPELNAINIFVKNNNFKEVTVYLCENDFSNHYLNLNENIKISHFNSWTKALYKKNEKLANLSPESIEKKFIALNLRNDLHKELLINFLYTKDSFYSRCENYNSDKLHSIMKEIKEVDENYYLKILKGYGELKDKVIFLSNEKEVITGKSKKSHTEYIRPISVNGPSLYTERSFCFVDLESRFFNIFPYFSEKIYSPIMSLRPFILASTPGSLELLKKEGFKTFDQWWDESYDTESDHLKRLVKIFDLIEYINSFSIIELKEMLKDMESVLQHNYKFAKQYSKSAPS